MVAHEACDRRRVLGKQIRFQRHLSEMSHGKKRGQRSEWSRACRLLSREEYLGGLFVKFLCLRLLI